MIKLVYQVIVLSAEKKIAWQLFSIFRCTNKQAMILNFPTDTFQISRPLQLSLLDALLYSLTAVGFPALC